MLSTRWISSARQPQGRPDQAAPRASGGRPGHKWATPALQRPAPVGAEVQRRPGAGATGLEPATSGVTGRRSNQLSYAPVEDGSMARMSQLRGVGRVFAGVQQQDLILSLVAVLCAALAVATVAFAMTFGG